MLRLAFSLLVAAAAVFPGAAAAQDLAQLEAAARANRRDADAQVAYGHALIRAARYRDAYRVLHDAARLRGNTLAAHFDAALAAFAEGDYRRSRAACRQLETRGRQEVLTKVCRARAFLVWNRAGRAFEELEAAIAQDPRSFDAQLALGDAHRLRASVAEAEAAYRAAIALDGARYEPRLGLGLLYAAARREADALPELEAAYAREQADPTLLYELAIRKEGAEARRLLGEVVALRPEHMEARVALADLDRAAGDAAAAREGYEAVLRATPESAPAQYGLAVLLHAEGDHPAARERLLQALDIVPNYVDAVLLLGRTYEGTDDADEAYAQYRRANDLDPRNPEGMLRAARLALTKRRPTFALGFLDRLLQQQPNLGEALALYGDAMRARGDRQAAIRFYERALSEGRGAFDRAATERALAEARGERPAPGPLPRATGGG